MTDQHNGREPRRSTKNIPPLAWIIVLVLLGLAAIAYSQWGGARTTPSGGEVPQVKDAGETAVVTPPNAVPTEQPRSTQAPAADKAGGDVQTQ